MKQALVRVIGCIWLMAIVGCAGTGEVIPLQLQPASTGPKKQVQSAQHVRVAVSSFEDRRSYQTGLGVRTHLWGGVTYFDVPGSKPADAVAQAFIDYLRAQGWQVVEHGNSEGADVAIAGTLEEFVVRAKSRVGATEITVSTKLTLRATNSADGSVLRMVLSGSGEEDVFWFDLEDVQGVVNAVLSDSFSKLPEGTTVVDRMLRLKRP